MSVGRRRSRAIRRAPRRPEDRGATQGQPAFAPRPSRPSRGVMRVAARWRWTLVAATLAAGLAGYLAARGAPPEYEASTKVLVGPLSGESKPLRAAGQLTQTYAQLATSRTLLDTTARRTGVARGDLRIAARANPVTRLLIIRARHGDARLSARIANVHTDNLVALVTRRGAGSARSGRVEIVEHAVPERTPVGPSALAIAAGAALAGLLAALALALLLDRPNPTVRSAEDVEAATRAPCVGVLTRAAVRAARRSRPVVEAASRSRSADEFRLLAAKLDAGVGRSLLVMAVHGESAPLARNLAAALADHGVHVALVDVAAPAPEAGVVPARGYAEANGDGDPAVRQLPGTLVASPAEPGGERAQAAIEQLEAHADVVVLHASGLERSPGALAWARVADGTVLVAQRDHTLLDDLRATAETLRLAGAPIVGTVLAEPEPALRR